MDTMAVEFSGRNESKAETPGGRRKKWDEKDIEILRLVVLLSAVNPSEERLEWVFDEVRTIARMARAKNKRDKT